MRTLTVTNWTRWQSYRADRGQPPWIKIHRTLLRNPEWVALTDTQRGHLVQIWILAADKNGTIQAADDDLPGFIQRICCFESTPSLEVLESLGFISLDAKATPTRRQHDVTLASQSREDQNREETETEVQLASRRHGAKPTEVIPTGLLIFPTVGTGAHQWPLTQVQVDEWTALYPGLDILAECRKAFAWVQANKRNRKTAEGMEIFLVKWLNRATDRGSSTATFSSRKTAGNKAAAKAFLEGRLND